ncbi:MAG: hypothetical protein ACREP4_06960 [Stenotrophomonas sp.]|uniref:hypothetical protein n=1 Tax=Stenotrophomonas sp. TaxID=69392 RepID=UPI003D6CF33D
MTSKRNPIVLTALLTLTAATPLQVLDAPLWWEQNNPRNTTEGDTAANAQALPHRVDSNRKHSMSAMQPTPLQQQRLVEQNLRETFRGTATSCAGGGKAILYLRGATPSRSGCSVNFEARCRGSASARRTRFKHARYGGAGCGQDDRIRIGAMACAPAQVEIQMTDARCD